MIRFTLGALRERIDPTEVAVAREQGSLVLETRRRRPRYFDGRFLTASDLTRDQTYFLQRQADLGRALGSGVARGLMVSRGPDVRSLRILAGHGITPSGEAVVLDRPLDVRLDRLPELQRLNAAFGLSRMPGPSPRTRTGLYVVALRPIEYTANPVSAYPRTVTEPSSAEDGDIVEATAVTLVPYPQRSGGVEPAFARAWAAREIFVEGVRPALPADALPLAMVSLNTGAVEWIDPFLVRREVGAEHGDVLGLGFAPRALREAHLIQYDHHVEELAADLQGRAAAAAMHFRALPPAGRIPVSAIDAAALTQRFFPPQMNVELSLVPEDEIRALLEESLLLPPIDLTLPGDAQESTAILVLAPVPRAQLRAWAARLTLQPVPLRPAVLGPVLARRPMDSLRLLLERRTPELVPVQPQPAERAVGDAAWRELLAGRTFLWYTRRRNVAFRSELTGQPVRVRGDEFRDERDLVRWLNEAGLRNRFTHLKTKASAEADAEMVAMLTSPRLREAPVLMDAALRELARERRLSQARVLEVAAPYKEAEFGEGVLRLIDMRPALQDDATVADRVARSIAITNIDRLGRELADETALRLADELVAAARETPAREAPARVAALVGEWIARELGE